MSKRLFIALSTHIDHNPLLLGVIEALGNFTNLVASLVSRLSICRLLF